MSYEMFLFYCLLIGYDEQFSQRPYDEQFQVLPALYDQFRSSVYDDPNDSLYDCITLYLNNTYGSRFS